MKKISWIIPASLILSAFSRFQNKETGDTKHQRIVCLSKQLTEMVFALGRGHDIVAVDLSSTYPDSAKLLKTVGYHRALAPEPIIAMKPDLVIHSNDIGPENVLPQITNAGLNVKAFGGANTIDSAKLLLKELGKFFGEEKRADSIIKKMDEGITKATDTIKAMKIHDSLRVMIIHFGLRNNNYFVMSGRNGVGDKMLHLAGASVTLYEGKASREMNAEAVAMANPNVIVATDFGFDRMGSMDKFITDVPGVSFTNAGKT